MTTRQLNTNRHQEFSDSQQNLICRTFSLSQAVRETISGAPVVLINLCPTKEALLELCNRLAEHYNSAPFSEIDEIKISSKTAEDQNSIRTSLEAHPAQYRAKVGDILIIDNDALLHGRSAISATHGTQRLVRRVCLECPEFFTGL